MNQIVYLNSLGVSAFRGSALKSMAFCFFNRTYDSFIQEL